jgi:hypothetical protein
MVILGLVLGVLVAVIVASQGCGENHPKRRSVSHALIWSGAGASAARAHA